MPAKAAPPLLQTLPQSDGSIIRIYGSRSRGDNVRYRCHGHNGNYVCNCGGARRALSGACAHMDHSRALDEGASAAAVDSTPDQQPAAAATIQRPPIMGAAPVTQQATPPPAEEEASTVTQAVTPYQQPTTPAPADMQPLVIQRPTVSRLPTSDEFEMMMKIAGSVVGAANQPNAERMVPANIKTPEQALAVMLAGHDRGMPPTVSLARIFIVNGRCEFDAQAQMGIVRDWDPTAYFEWSDYSRERASVRLWRNDRPVSPWCTYDVQDAKDSGQWWKGARLKVAKWKQVNGKSVPESYVTDDNGEPIIETPGVWQNYTRDMLAWKAVTRACRLGASDALNQIDTGRRAAAITGPRYSVQEVEQMAETLPAPPLAKALREGTVTPAQVFADAEPDNDIAAEEDETYTEAQDQEIIAAEAAAVVDTDDDAGVPDAEMPATPPEEPVAPPQAPKRTQDRAGVVLAINGLLIEAKQTWDNDSYAALTADCKERWPSVKGTDGKLHFSKLADADLVPAYEYLRRRISGEPPA